MPRIRYTHFCHRPGLEGQPGEERDVSREQAQLLMRDGGAVLVKPPVRTATAGPQEVRADAPADEAVVESDDARRASPGGPDAASPDAPGHAAPRGRRAAKTEGGK